MSKDCSCFTQIINYNSKDLVWILINILVQIIALGCPKSVPNFSWIGVQVCKLEQFFTCEKDEKRKNEKK